MKITLLLWLALLLGPSPALWAQTLIQSQSFETGEAVNYTSNTFDLRSSMSGSILNNQYFTITTTNPAQNPNLPSNYSLGNASDPVTIKNAAGTADYVGNFWIGEGIRGTSNTGTPVRDPGYVQLNAVNASGYTAIKVTVALADPRGPGSIAQSGAAATPTGGTFGVTDKIEIQYSTDGGANYIPIGRFMGNNNNGSNGFLEQDVDLNGEVLTETSPTLNYQMKDFTFNVVGSPASLIVRVVADQSGTSQELAFDNIRVMGTPTTVQAPTLTDAQSGTVINYTEGDPATLITTTIQANNPAGTNLTGATVSMTSSVISNDDQLTFTGIANSNISGNYDNLTRTLTFTGSSAEANYQTILQSVRYVNTNGSTARGGNRIVQFVVSTGSSTSSAVIRNVLVKAVLSGPASLPYTEDFTTDGEGARYGSNTFAGDANNTGFAFTRTSANPYAAGAVTFSNISNTSYWYGVNPSDIRYNPSQVGRLETQQVDATRYANLRFQIRLGASSGSTAAWQASDSFKMYYRTGGSSGTWKLFGSFRGNTTVINGTADMRQDRTQDLANLPTLPAGTATLTPALTNFAFDLPADANGQLVDFKLELIADDGRAQFAFDLIQVTGTPTTTVNSIVRASANPTNAAAVNYTVTFGAAVTGLTAANFTLTPTGTASGTVGTPVAGAGNTWTVPITGIAGNGTLTLNLANDTGLSSGISTTLPFAGETYTIDKTAPTVSSSNRQSPAANPTAATSLTYRVTLSEAVVGVTTSSFTFTTTGGTTGTIASVASVSGSGGTQYDVTVNSVNGNGTGRIDVKSSGSGITDAAGNALSGGFTGGQTYTINQSVTVVSVTRLDPSPTATAQVRYQVVFSGSVAGLAPGNFTPTVTNGSISGASVFSVSGSGTTYTVVVNTGSSSSTSTLRLDVSNSTGTTPTITNVPYTAGEEYTITKSFPAAPTLRIQAAGSASGNGDVTAFVDVVQVLQSGTSTVVPNGLQNGSFETNNVPASGFKKTADGVVAAPWSFTGSAGVARYGSPFDSQVSGQPQPLPPNGDAVALIQSAGNNNASLSQNLAVPTGSYQVNFQMAQRYYTAVDQRLNVFVNNVFVGSIQTGQTPAYGPFTSASFSVTAPALTATVSSAAAASGGTTTTTPIPFAVDFSQSVGSSFTDTDVTVTNGTITAGSFSGSGAG
ncbi:beta strand repeat-containing protein, partial [Hymenobacter persicinus]